MELKLTVEMGPHQGLTFSTDKSGTWQIGRLKDADLALTEDKFTSRKHCAIEFSSKGAILCDVGGRSGTYVNGQRVKQTQLNDGDIIWIGRSAIRVHISGVEPATVTTPRPVDIPGFTLVKQLPNDGPGEARLAYADRAQQMVTLHFLQQVSPDEDQQKRFLREAGICSRLRHSNLVRFLEQGIADNTLWFVTETVDGQDLTQFVAQRGPLPMDQALAIIAQVMDVVAYLHQQDVIHRSLCPTSLLVKKIDDTFSVRLADLGSAKCFQEFQSVTNIGECGFAIHPFTAPESLIDFRTLNPRSDIYALGGILYFALSGQPLYQTTPEQDLVMTILDSDPTPLITLRPDLPPNIIEVVNTATVRDAKTRYRTVADMQRALFGDPTSVPGIPPLLYQRLYKALTLCEPFGSDNTLKPVFSEARISPWRDGVPQAQSTAARVQAVIHWLHTERDATGNNALVLLLYVLRDQTDLGNALHQELTTLADELEASMKLVPYFGDKNSVTN